MRFNMRSGRFAKMLSIAGIAPMLASVQGCEPPVCSMFGEQIRAEGCGESSKLNSAPRIVQVTNPSPMKPGRQEDFVVRVKDDDDDFLWIEWDLDGDGDWDKGEAPILYQKE